LRGGSGVAGDKGGGGDPDDEGLDVWAYFSSACYSGFGDDDSGFYGVYNRVFRDIAASEAKHDGKKAAERPPFGDSRSAWGEVRTFYAWWEGFSTACPCANADTWDTRDAPNRQVRVCVRASCRRRSPLLRRRDERAPLQKRAPLRKRVPTSC
jgi:DnaJ family protein A protein 5